MGRSGRPRRGGQRVRAECRELWGVVTRVSWARNTGRGGSSPHTCTYAHMCVERHGVHCQDRGFVCQVSLTELGVRAERLRFRLGARGKERAPSAEGVTNSSENWKSLTAKEWGPFGDPGGMGSRCPAGVQHAGNRQSWRGGPGSSPDGRPAGTSGVRAQRSQESLLLLQSWQRLSRPP